MPVSENTRYVQCLPWTNLPCDLPFWVPREQFLTLFDQVDFAHRECQDVKSEYRSDWFYELDGASRSFIIPTVQFCNGRTEFINGRHRTAVLIKYLDFLPLALVHPFLIEKSLLDQITRRPIRKNQLIDLPDLPILKSDG